MIRYIKRKFKFIFKRKSLKTSDEIMAAIRHDCHRIEKSVYNNILVDKFEIYKSKAESVRSLFGLLKEEQQKDPSMKWAKKIITAFPEIKNSFIVPNKQPTYSFDSDLPNLILNVMKARRSNRVWATRQPSKKTLEMHALKMIEAAITAPCSGNRQGIRFKIIVDNTEKSLLKGLKENHCYSAPLLIFVGVQKDVYYSLGESDKNSKYLDAAASAMQIINFATSMNYATCWNHFDKYMVTSRKKSIRIYKQFTSKLNIPSNIEPIAIIAIGNPEFVVPTPIRMDMNNFILRN